MSIIFNMLTTVSCAYALLRGGAPERIAAIIVLVAVGVTIVGLPSAGYRYATVEARLLMLDLVTFAAFQALALRADRFWPIWIAGLQQATVLAHVARMLTPDILPLAYAIGTQAWAWLIVILIGIGTRRHRLRVRATGTEPAWSSHQAGRQAGAHA